MKIIRLVGKTRVEVGYWKNAGELHVLSTTDLVQCALNA